MGFAHGRTALMEVIDNVEPEAVEFLSAHGADVKAATTSGDTPLHFAAGEGYLDVVQLYEGRVSCICFKNIQVESRLFSE